MKKPRRSWNPNYVTLTVKRQPICRYFSRFHQIDSSFRICISSAPLYPCLSSVKLNQRVHSLSLPLTRSLSDVQMRDQSIVIRPECHRYQQRIVAANNGVRTMRLSIRGEESRRCMDGGVMIDIACGRSVYSLSRPLNYPIKVFTPRTYSLNQCH